MIDGLRKLLAIAVAASAVLLAAAGAAHAADFDYRLHPEKIADNTWVVIGATEDFNTGNGGNIVNTAFVATGAGVVVFDTGPSRRYGEQLRQAIAAVTPEKIVLVINSHVHPDHFLGNQAFPRERLYALPGTIKGIGSEGNVFAENLYRLTGDWMLGTEVVVPPNILHPGPLAIGSHQFEVIALAGHTEADLVLLDRTTGVAFTGDLVFFGRAATTPHAKLPRWLEALDRIEALAVQQLVPGHGAVTGDGGRVAISETRSYLIWLDRTLEMAANRGLDMTEALALPLPPEIRKIPLADVEFRRSVVHLYPAAEQRALANRH